MLMVRDLMLDVGQHDHILNSFPTLLAPPRGESLNGPIKQESDQCGGF